MPGHATSRRDAGVTLLEVVIVLAVLASCMLGVASLAHVSLIETADARDETVATFLAAQKLEQLRVSPVIASAAAGAAVGSLDANVSGYFEVVDESGLPFGTRLNSYSPPYLRRWAAASSPQPDAPVIVCAVRVMRVRSADGRQMVGRTEATVSSTRFAR